MTLKPYLVFLLAATLAVSCGQPARRNAECVGSLETSAKQTTVKTVSGPVAGYLDDGVFIYKGIPYAKAERFAPAVDPDPWTDVRPSRAFGPTAPAPARSGWWSDDQAFTMHWDDGFHDEDCLRVNVWTGGIHDGKKRPVMVWLHGGGFREGSGQELICYDGTNLARDHGVVVVSLNHRLNVLGFLDLSAFGAKYAHSGNLGMMDIVKALEWVRENIASFGGDPANVTIFGQSGGGGKVSTLMAMPSAKGLFSKAIVESGSITNLLSPKYSRRIGAATVANLGLTPSRIEEIATVPYDRLLAAYDAAMKTVAEEAREDGAFPANLLDAILFGQVPVVDGEIIPVQPGTAEALALSLQAPGAPAGAGSRVRGLRARVYVSVHVGVARPGRRPGQHPLPRNSFRLRQRSPAPYVHGWGRRRRRARPPREPRLDELREDGRSVRRRAPGVGSLSQDIDYQYKIRT